MITPQPHAWKGAKWIGEIEFRDYDELGYWEKRGYSNTAEPWLNDRYSSVHPLDLLSKPNMCRITIATHQPSAQNQLLLHF